MLGVLCLSAVATGDIDRAHVLAQEGLEIARRIGDLLTEAYAAMPAGVVLAHRGEFDEAERLLEESVRGARRLGNVRSVANWTRALGGIALARGDYPKARLLFEESLEHPPHARRPVGDLSLAVETCARVPGAPRQRCGAAPGRGEPRDRAGGRRPAGAALRLRGVRGARCRRKIARCARSGCTRVRACFARRWAATRWSPAGPSTSTTSVRVRSALGEDAFAEAWEQGRAMTLDEALDYALEEDADPKSRMGSR